MARKKKKTSTKKRSSTTKKASASKRPASAKAMARKRRTPRQAQGDNDHEKDEVGLRPETKRGVAVVVLLLLGLLGLLSLFGLAGPLGESIARGLIKLFGWGDFLFPIILLILGYVLLLPHRFTLRPINFVGLGLLVLSLYGLLHVTQGLDQSLAAASAGRGGGYFGLILSWPLQQILGLVAAGLVILALLIISALLTFNASLDVLYGEGNIFSRLWRSGKTRLAHLRYSGEHANEYANEDEFDANSEEAGEINEVDDDGARQQSAEAAEQLGESATESSSEAKSIVIEDSKGVQEELLQVPRRRLPRIELPLELLTGKVGKPTSGDIRANQQIISQTLDNFGIEVEMGDVSVGPTVTQYTLRPATGVKLSQITTLQNDLALALAAHPVRIEAPIPGKSLVGLEVPNKAAATVALKELLTSSEFRKGRSSSLTLTIGKDVSGKTYLADLKKMPHLLIAGATGSGKSVAINTILLGLMYQNQPSDLRFILVDPKRVELTPYADIPYLLAPVIIDVKKTISSLKWAVGEMERRLTVLSHSGKRNIEAYNKSVDGALKMPYLIIVIDELADLMATAAAEVEGSIVRLAQMARAVGIHLIVATQRPSVDVLTGLIKANITSRIAFAVPSLVDSRTILDSSGAEKLLGRGDMLFISAELGRPKRLQGAFVSDQEIEAVTKYLKSKAKPDYHDVSERKSDSSGGSDDYDADGGDELLSEAKEVIRRAGKASASLLQRRLRIGYARAARILDILEDQGAIGPAEGAKPREVYLSEEGLDRSDGDEGFDEQYANENANGEDEETGDHEGDKEERH